MRYIVLCAYYIIITLLYRPWHRGPTHWPDTHFILQILDGAAAAAEDDDDATAANPLPEGGVRRAGNFTSDSVEKSGDMPDRGTTLVPFSVRPGEGHPPPPSTGTKTTKKQRNYNSTTWLFIDRLWLYWYCNKIINK